jgi:putative acetyltransferase
MTIIIRAMREADLPALIRLRNMPGVRWGTLATPFQSVQQGGTWHSSAMNASENVFLVACAGEELAGTASLFRARPVRRAHTATLGIMVADGWQGKGVGTALFAALTDLADNWLNLHRLELAVYTDNIPALALYKKFGFEIEATERMDAFREGRFADSHLMARLRPGLTPDTSTPPPPATPAPHAPFTLRAPEPADLPGITALMNLPHVRRGTLRAPFSTPAQNQFLATPAEGSKSIVAMAGDTVCGIATLVPSKGRCAHVADLALLAVHDSWVRRGIGHALLGAMLGITDNWLNLTRLSLSVLADNEAAIALYTAHGFIPEGRKRADVFREGGYADALVMARLRRAPGL